LKISTLEKDTLARLAALPSLTPAQALEARVS
jgi:hypothetical protein